MSIAIRMGHLKNLDQGAVGLVSEYTVNRAYTPYVIEALKRSGETVYDVTPEEGSSNSMYDSIQLGIKKANDLGVDLFVSCHVNSFSSPNVQGATGYCYPNSSNGKKLIMSIISEVSNLGFDNRGYMEGKDYWELKDTNMTAVIVEPFFCVSPVDVDIYNKVGAKGLGEAIAKGILNYLGKPFVEEVVPVVEVKPVEVPKPNAEPYIKDVSNQGIGLQVFDDHLEVIWNGKVKVINFDN